MPVHARKQRQQLTRSLFAALRAAARPLCLSVVIVMTTVALAPVLVFAAQQNEDALFICRPAIDGEGPAAPAPSGHTCPCPGLCGIGGPVFTFGGTGNPAFDPPLETALQRHGDEVVRIAIRYGLRPFLRGPPQVFESL